MTIAAHEVRLARKPAKPISPDDFSVVPVERGPLGPGDVLVEVLYLSLDPYIAMQIHGRKVHGTVIGLGEAVRSRLVGRVLATASPEFEIGGLVRGIGPWSDRAMVPASALERLATDDVPVHHHLGVLGISGITAWVGIRRVAQVVPGETLIVTGASGAVGSVAGQLAQLTGCRVVGIAGGPAKCQEVVSTLGFEHCLDHHADPLPQEILRMFPKGAGVCFENVGGRVFDAILPALADHARIVLCGMIAHYEATTPLPFANLHYLLERAVSLNAFRVSEHRDFHAQALAELSGHVRGKRLACLETITEGLANAPAAFARMLSGQAMGKSLVRVTQ